MDSFYKDMKVEDVVVPADLGKESPAANQKAEDAQLGTSDSTKGKTAGSVDNPQQKNPQQQSKDDGKQ
jgi:hypothetical protein